MSYKHVLIFGPNGGVSLSTGGGVNFVMKMAKSLLDLGVDSVTLAAYHSFSLRELEELNDIHLDPSRIRLISTNAVSSFDLFMMLPFKLSAYNFMLLKRFHEWVRRTIDRSEPDLIIFNDDIPTSAKDYLRNKNVILYAHNPIYTLEKNYIPILSESIGIPEYLNYEILNHIRTFPVIRNPEEYCDRILVNSTVTKRVMESAGIKADLKILYTYVETSRVHNELEKKNQFLSVGTFSRHKKYEVLIKAFTEFLKQNEDWKLVIAGYPRDTGYLRKLRKLREQSENPQAISFKLNNSKDDLILMMKESVSIVHSAPIEAFGLSPLEGMSFGDYPVVLNSEFSGLWTDVLERGKIGLGFQNETDLAKCMLEITKSNRYAMKKEAVKQSMKFNQERFRDSLSENVLENTNE